MKLLFILASMLLIFIASVLLMIGTAEARTAAHARTTATHARTTESHRAIAIGPWQIEASFTKQREFDRCVMRRTIEEGIETQFTRGSGGLSLMMSSPRWQLQKGKKYPVEFFAGSLGWKAKVSASSEEIRIALTDQHFNEALKSADVLEVRAAGSTIKVPLDKSAAALKRLESCFETNSKATEKNPFIAPKP
jgi:hypothetical protein